MWQRRALLQRLAQLGLCSATGLMHGLTHASAALPPRTLVFPRDHGAHPELATEWWYITGHAKAEGSGREFGFQVTFFRKRVAATQGMNSAFAAKQLVLAHVALTDLQGRQLLHDQRIAREGFGVAEAQLPDARLRLRDWSLARNASDGTWQARILSADFALDLRFTPTQALLLQGNQGLSRKGPQATQASYYYSLPQLAANGQITLHGQRLQVSGQAWLDHEWSDALLHPEAVGWDWIGMNLHDGSALTAFRLRNRAGQALWAGGSVRSAAGALRVFGPDEVQFQPLRHWHSPQSQADYPVAWQVNTPAGRNQVHTLLDNQELDSRQSTGATYWEGLSELRDAAGQVIGRGYLEMTGYAQALRL